MQHNTIASVGRQCYSRNSACMAAAPRSCREFSCRPTMKLASSTPSIPSHCRLFREVSSIATQSTRASRLWQERNMSSVACTTLTTPNPASSKSCTSTSSLGVPRQHYTFSLKHYNNFSLNHRQIRHYTKPRDYASKIFTDKNGSAVGPKTAGTRVLLVIGSVVVLWFVLNYAIGAAIMILLKGSVKTIWGAVWWAVSGVLGALRAVFGL